MQVVVLLLQGKYKVGCIKQIGKVDRKVYRLPEGNWSAPSAIGTGGIGAGGQIGNTE